VPQSFKMALPSMTGQLASNSIPVKNSEGRDDEWLALPMILSSTLTVEPTTVNEATLAKNTPEKEEFQNAEVHGPSWLNHFQGPTAKRLMIVNDTNKAWFYPSKGLNEFFYRAGKLATSNTKADTSHTLNPKPKTLSTTPANFQRRHNFVEVLKMAFGGDNGKRQEARRVVDEGCEGGSSEGRGNFVPAGCYNPRHERGRSYGGYARGWQRRSYNGYRYSGSRFNGGIGRGGGDHGAGHNTSHEHATRVPVHHKWRLGRNPHTGG
jgi:hypothetical protein